MFLLSVGVWLSIYLSCGDTERPRSFFVLKNTFSSFVNSIKVILKFQSKGLEAHGDVRSLFVTDKTKFGNFVPTFEKFASIVNCDKVMRFVEIIHYKILSWNFEVVIEHVLWSKITLLEVQVRFCMNISLPPIWANQKTVSHHVTPSRPIRA